MSVVSSLKTPSGLFVPMTALLWSFTRASGPGGQNVNKVSSAATLSIDTLTVQGPAELVARVRDTLGPMIKVSSQTSRSQQQNRKLCLQQAAELIEKAAHPPKPRRATAVPAAQKTKRLEDKKHAAKKKQDRKAPSRFTTGSARSTSSRAATKTATASRSSRPKR